MDEETRRGVGRRLKEFRVSLGMTQMDLALEIKAQRQSLSAWESGRTLPMADAWLALGRLGMSLDYVLLGIRSVPVSQYAARAYLALNVRETPPSGAASGIPERLPAS
jgi:DNA-binding XRE family transcriptional regulator